MDPGEAEVGGEATTTAGDAGDGRPRWDWRHPSLEGVVLLLFLVMAVRIGLAPLSDNSFLTHLATGRLILDSGIPTTDPYSFTAAGEPWTVQSWGASTVYATLERSVGLVGIRVLNALCAVGLVLLLWRLSRPVTSLVARVVVVGLPVCMGMGQWVERPLLFGALALAVVLVAAEGELDPRWLVPVMVVWVNVHGSFPFALAVLGLLAAGRWLDDRRRPVVELRALVWAGVGTVLAAAGPLGTGILTFPFSMLEKREAFAEIVEWNAPTWDRGVERFFAVQLLLTVVVVLVRHRRWRAVLPVAAFGLAAVTSTRNVLPAAIVLTPILAQALAGLGSVDGRARKRSLRPVVAALSVLMVLVVAAGVSGPDTALGRYPEDAAEWMRERDLLGPDDRVVHRDYVGNYLEFRYGPDEVRTFFDDRVDMYPLEVNRQYVSLLRDGTDHATVLDEVGATAVLWDRDSRLGRWLVETASWRVVYQDEDWLVALPTGA